MYAEQRHQLILDELRQSGEVSVTALAAKHNVAAETIRRDLDHLGVLRALRRVHGGAVLAAVGANEPDLLTRLRTNTAAKRRIGQAASRLLEGRPEATIAIDAGSTTGSLVPHLPKGAGPIVTDALAIAQAVLDRGHEVYILPGHLRELSHAAVGSSTVDTLRGYHPDIAFLGCNGMDDAGFTTPDPLEAAVKTAMIRQSELRVMMADSSKEGTHHFASFARVAEINVLVSDTGLSPHYIEHLQDQGIEVICV
ncbi:MAG: DeoR/GlpR family DNA-binding transcription regulator [Ancrocorticia sp.]|uniref:DeoR/GlpR family DNA-binding transcription regulator n=1 Tax=Ancrocorticia sp. TaxID=2593684 RepID=UPI003F93BCB4